MEKDFLGYPIIAISANENNTHYNIYIDIIGTKEDAFLVKQMWNEENKFHSPRIMAVNPEEIGENHFHVELI